MKGESHDRIEWRGILDFSEYESRNRSETTFGAHAIVPSGPENICNPFSRANFPLIPILSCQKSTLIPSALTLATGDHVLSRKNIDRRALRAR